MNDSRIVNHLYWAKTKKTKELNKKQSVGKGRLALRRCEPAKRRLAAEEHWPEAEERRTHPDHSDLSCETSASRGWAPAKKQVSRK